MQIKLILAGYGNVGKEFVKLIHEKASCIQKEYGLELLLAGIIGRDVKLYRPEGLYTDTLLALGDGSAALHRYIEQHPVYNENMEGHVLIESTPTNIESGEPGKQYILQAIENGMDIVSISKGALVTSWKEISEAARVANVSIRYSGATAAALPTLDIGQFSLAGCKIKRIEGILNGTTNYILTKMYEDNTSYEEALQQAQSKGIAETNPVLDVSGMDSACKLLLLSNSLLHTEYTLEDMSMKGIENVSKQDIQKAKKQGKQIKLLARASTDDDGKVRLEVQPFAVDLNHSLAGVTGTEKGITFYTDTMGSVTSIGGASNPRGAAAAALKDVINLYRKDRI
ncbi:MULTISPECIES: homoserine dehydrogenase [unclassified Bacillus (in: firmicutes)]|uniref:homoserine dehydrogenase n=1 Tax=unclassified Bacillus (in: firmicutes) TaxID=185979 RepID=UPI0008E6450F|nr:MULTISPECIES: homoserine dehydrogenase [unclassified Bacillus (in: firmicutes)]SFI76084.1 homoserine dehydrogenase [Bacillus sp. 71mf]SFS87313.1 homoserine dehydrogenase [Bacillus sp. 103mf]